MANTIDLGQVLQFQDSTAKDVYPSFSTLLNNLLPNLYLLSGLVIFFLIFFGGFTLIANAGNVEKQQEGKQIITGALIGFLVVVLSYLIIQIIQVVTGVPILNFNL